MRVKNPASGPTAHRCTIAIGTHTHLTPENALSSILSNLKQRELLASLVLAGTPLSPQGGYWVIATKDSAAYSWLGWSQGWGSGVSRSAFHCPVLSSGWASLQPLSLPQRLSFSSFHLSSL